MQAVAVQDFFAVSGIVATFNKLDQFFPARCSNRATSQQPIWVRSLQ